MAKLKKSEYAAKVRGLGAEEAERLLSRMGGKLARRLEKNKLSREEALAAQMELEDEQLLAWRESVAKAKSKEEAKKKKEEAKKSKQEAKKKAAAAKPKPAKTKSEKAKSAKPKAAKTKAAAKTKTAPKPKAAATAEVPAKLKAAHKIKVDTGS